MLVAWFATGRHAYTKFEVVEQVEVAVPADDPLAVAGFYEGETRTQTVRRAEFHLGLLPVPQGLFDKHALSVISLTLPPWLLTALLVWRGRKQRRTATAERASSSDPTFL